jgi:hypothetical protein
MCTDLIFDQNIGNNEDDFHLSPEFVGGLLESDINDGDAILTTEIIDHSGAVNEISRIDQNNSLQIQSEK